MQGTTNPQSGTKSSFSSPCICTGAHRNPVTCSANPGSRNNDLVPVLRLGGRITRPRALAICPSMFHGTNHLLKNFAGKRLMEKILEKCQILLLALKEIAFLRRFVGRQKVTTLYQMKCFTKGFYQQNSA
jgi:hypothetical protein